jgi:hypothetical protein
LAALFRAFFWCVVAAHGLSQRWARLRKRFVLPQSGLRMELLIGSFGPALGAFDQQLADLHEIVGEHRGANKQFEVLGAFGATTLHATTAHQYRDAALYAGAETLAILECARSLAGLALRRPDAAALRNRDRGDAAVHARLHVLLTEEAAIGAVDFRTSAEDAAVMLQRGYDMDLVHRIPLEHFVLSDQTDSALGEKHLVAELDWCAHLAALDQVGMRLEDRIDFFCSGHLFAVEHAATRRGE